VARSRRRGAARKRMGIVLTCPDVDAGDQSAER
jgi:hypothetical protein